MTNNVAPVTVEQRDRMLFAVLFGVLPSASPIDQRALRNIARHRLPSHAAESVTEWRCFHCGDVFTDEGSASLHFGRDEDSEPACVIKAGAEQGLLGALREAEDAAADARHAIADETTDSAKAYYAQATRHAAALRNAEEAGYERGLADGRGLAGNGVKIEDSEKLTAPQLDAVCCALAFVTAGDWDESSHEHRIDVYERAHEKLARMNGRIVRALAHPRTAADHAFERTLAAGRIIDVMTGGKFDWRSRLQDDGFLGSADWATALAYADAALPSDSECAA